jgi:hypothetical protein
MTRTQIVTTETVTDFAQSRLMSDLFNVKGTTFISMDAETVPDFKGKKVENPYWNSTEGQSRVLKTGGVYGMVGHIYKNVVNNARDKEVIEAGEACGIDKAQLEMFFAKFDKSVNHVKGGEFVPKRHKWAMHCYNPILGGTSRIIMKNKKWVAAHYKSVKESTLPDGVTLDKELEFLDLKDIDVNNINIDKIHKLGHTSINFDECECRHQEDGKRYIMIWTFGAKDTNYIYSDTRENLTTTDHEGIKEWLKDKTSNAAHQGLKKENEIVVRTFAFESVKGIRMKTINYQIS